jgi:hypothetical protein
MNILIDKFPTKTMIDGEIYELNTDFRNCLQIILACESKEVNEYERADITLELLYKKIPDNREKAIEKALLFLDCGEENKVSEGNSESFRKYSFTKDAKYIYSAIKQTHNIDLENIEYLHWWKFVYLFLDLNKESFFSQMLYLRGQKQKGKLSKEEKELYIKLIDILELDQDNNYTEEEKEQINKFNSLLGGAEDNEEI